MIDGRGGGFKQVIIYQQKKKMKIEGIMGFQNGSWMSLSLIPITAFKRVETS